MAKASVAYIRYSSESQRDSTSVDIQIDACNKTAGFTLRTYIDEAKSGRATAGREQFHRLVADAAAGLIDRVFVYRFDRLGRNEADTFSVVQELEEYGVAVVSATEGRDAITRGIHLVMAAHYSRELSAKTKAGMMKRHEQGAFTGGRPPYGYRVEEKAGKKVLVIDDEEAKTVRLIFDLYTGPKPEGFKNIARKLTESAIPTRSETLRAAGVERINRVGTARRTVAWGQSSVRAILANPIYIGQVIYNKTTFKLDRKNGKRRPVRNSPDQAVIHQDEALRLIDQSLWDSVRLRMEGRKSGVGAARSNKLIRPFTGMLFCGDCGSAFYARTSSNSKGSYTYYNCGCRQRSGPDACSNAAVLRENDLLGMIQSVCALALADVDSVVGQILEETNREERSQMDRAARLQTEIADVTTQIEGRTMLLFDPEIGTAAKREISAIIADLSTRRDSLRSSLDDLAKESGERAGQTAVRVREELLRARMALGSTLDSATLNGIIGEFIGPSVVTSEGRLLAAETTRPAGEGGSCAREYGGGGI